MGTTRSKWLKRFEPFLRQLKAVWDPHIKTKQTKKTLSNRGSFRPKLLLQKTYMEWGSRSMPVASEFRCVLLASSLPDGQNQPVQGCTRQASPSWCLEKNPERGTVGVVRRRRDVHLDNNKNKTKMRNVLQKKQPIPPSTNELVETWTGLIIWVYKFLTHTHTHTESHTHTHTHTHTCLLYTSDAADES